MERRVWLPLLIFMAAALSAGAIGATATMDAAQKYEALEKPSWAPPPWLFGPVWSALYILIGIAGWQIWLRDGNGRTVTLWGVQMAMNAFWSPLFFAFEWRLFAFAWILVLDVVVAWLIWKIWRHGWPGWILLPYLAWIAFASALNGAVWILN